jgi:TetR/AcrR family transcriptional regulator, regulator of autoinduction and epiphytic fitness
MRFGAIRQRFTSSGQDGEISPEVDPELATTTLLGVIFYRRLMTGEPFDPGDADELVSLVLG